MPGTGTLWQSGDFLRLWAAQFGSGIGSRITRTVLPMFALLLIEASPAQIAILAACEVAPGLLVSLAAGGLADRRAKRPMLIGADVLRAALMLLLPVLAALDAVQIWHLYLAAAAMGAAGTLFSIVDNTFLPALVPDNQLTEANAKLQATDAIAEGIGPWIGGTLVQTVGAPLALVADAVSYLWSAALLARIKSADMPNGEAPSASLLADAAVGLRRIRADRGLSLLLACETVELLYGGVLMALYTVIGIQVLQIGPAMLGLVIGIGGIGAFAGALAAGPLERALGERRALITCLTAGRIIGLAIPLAMAFPAAGLWLLITAQLLGDAALVTFGILALSLRQRRAPRQVLGRINASFHLLGQGALLAGTILAALGAMVMTLEALIWIAAAASFVTIALIRHLPPDDARNSPYNLPAAP